MPTNYDLTLGLSTGGAASDVVRLGNAAAKAGRQFDTAQGKISGAATSTTRYSGAATKAAKSAATAAKSTAAFGGATKQAGFNLAKTLKFAVATAAAYLSISAASLQMTRTIGVFAQFEKSMAAVQAVTTASDDAFGLMTMSARMLGETTVFSASQAAAGMEFLGRASFSATEIVSAMPGILALATGANIALGVSADITSNIMSGFGLAADQSTRIVDALTVATTSSNTEVVGMGQAMKFAAPIAKSLGIAMEEVAAVVGVFGDAGIFGTMAGTGLRTIMLALVDPTKEADKAIRSLGLQVADLSPETNSLTEIIGRLARASLGAKEATQIFGREGTSAILALTENAGRVGELTDKIKDSGGAAQDVADVMQDTLSGAGKELASVVESLRIAFGEQLEPVLRSSAEALKSFLVDQAPNIEAFGRIMASTLSAAGSGALLLADNVGILVGAFAVFLALKIPAAIVAIGASWSALTVLIVANPIGAALVAVGAILVAINGQITKLSRTWSREMASMVAATNEFTDAQKAIGSGTAAVISRNDLQELSDTLGEQTNQLEAARMEAAKYRSEMDDLAAAQEAAGKVGNRFAEEQKSAALAFNEANQEVGALEKSTDQLKDALREWTPVAVDASEAVGKVSDALQELRSEVVNQRSLATAMTAFGLSAESAKIAVGTLIAAEMEAGASAFEAANSVADMLGQEDNAAVLRVIELVKELREVADLQDRRLATIREIARIEGQGGLPDVRPVGPIALPPGFEDRDFGAFGGIPTGPDVEAIKAAERAAERLEGLAVAADILQDAFGGLDGVVGAVARALPGLLESVKAFSSGAIGKKEFAAAAIDFVGGLFGSQGRGGTGEHGEQFSGDFSSEGKAIGEAAGAVIGTFVLPVIGTVLGAAIGGLLGEVFGGLINEGADELVFGFTQAGDEIKGLVSRAEGPLAELGSQMTGALETIFSGIEAAIGGSIAIQGSEIAGGPEIQAAGEAAVIKLRDGLKIAFVNGLRREFETFDEAFAFITLELLKKAKFGEGVSEAVVAALTSGADSLEQLDERLQFALGFDKLLSELGPVATAMADFNTLLRIEGQQLKEIGLPASLSNQLLAKRISLLRDEIQAELRSVAGITDHAATLDRLAQANVDFTAGIDSQRASLEAQMATQREVLTAQTMTNEAAQGVAGELGDFSGVLIESRDGIMGFVTTGRNLNSTLADSERGMASTASEIAVLEEALSGLPDALDPDLLAQAFDTIALGAADSFNALLSQFEGFQVDRQAAEALRHAVAMGQIALELEGLKTMLATAAALSDVSRAALQAAVAAGETLLSGDFRLRRPGGGGGGKRAEADREAEAAADAQARASEAFSDAMATLRDQTSGATEGTLAWNQKVQDFRDLAMGAGAGTEAVAEGLRLMAEIDLRALGDAWATTAAQFRGSDLEGAVRDVGQRRQAAIDAANEREEFAPDAAAEAKKQIREGTRRQFAELGEAALDGFGGPMRRLNQDGKESVKTIEFLAANLGKLDITAAQLARTVKDAVLGPFLALAESEAIRVGDTQAASDIADRRMKIEKAFQIAQLNVWEAMLRAADAFTETLKKLFADTERRLNEPDAPGAPGTPGATRGPRRAPRVRPTAPAPRVLDVDALLGPFENLGLSALERELMGINSQFVDIRDTFQDIGATAPQWARLEAAQAGAIEAFWQRATDPLRDLLGELRRNDPRVTTEAAFFSARDEFRDLADRARGGDLGALDQLAVAGRDLLGASAAFKGEGVGSLALRDEVISALEELTGGAAFADPVVSEVREGNLILSEMRDILRATQGGVPRAARDRARALPPAAAASQSGSFVRSGSVGQQVVRLAARVDRQEGRGREDIRLLIAAFRSRDRKEDRRRATERTQDRATDVAVAEQRERLIAAVLAGNLQEAELLAEALANRSPSTGVIG